MTKTRTLIANQQGVKAVKLFDDVVQIFYADGGEPVSIHKEDEMFEYYSKDFGAMIDGKLNPPTPIAETIEPEISLV